MVLDDDLLKGIHSELEEFPKAALLKSLEKTIKSLKQKDFGLIELRFYQEKSFVDIGFILDCSENTAKVRAHRLIQKLRKELLKG